MTLGLRGDCLTCQKLSTCQETSVERVQTSYTCPLFKEVPEPVFRARELMMVRYGEATAIKGMLNGIQEQQGDEEDGT